MKLSLGIIKIKQLAEWFGISAGSLSNRKEEKLKELANYCKFEDLGKKGVNIKEIYEAEYKGSLSSQVRRWFNTLDEKTQKLRCPQLEKLFPIERNKDTIIKYLQECQREKFGKEWERELPQDRKDRGIYGIYYKDELVYIGKTNVAFEKRFSQHWEGIYQGQGMYLYEQLHKEDWDMITMKPIISLYDIKIGEELSNRDIESMELALITLYKPKYNRAGVTGDYIYSKIEEE